MRAHNAAPSQPPRAAGASTVLLQNHHLTAELTPSRGGEITRLAHLASDTELLLRTPWSDRVVRGEGRTTQRDPVAAWLERYAGGWQTIFPNAGNGCVHRGMRHSWHGEASQAPWKVQDHTDCSAELVFRGWAVPVELHRTTQLDGDRVVIEETVTNLTDKPTEVLWGQHPAFGGNLAAADSVLETNAAWWRDIGSDSAPSDQHPWPGPQVLPTQDSALHVLGGFPQEAWVALRTAPGTGSPLGICLSWNADVMPYAWWWRELNGGHTAPWWGRIRAVGLEPMSSWPATGLADVVATTGTHLTLRGHELRTLHVVLHVRSDNSLVTGIDTDGRAITDPATAGGTQP